jgi:manganese/zinc/iron transport system ATP- binding protein
MVDPTPLTQPEAALSVTGLTVAYTGLPAVENVTTRFAAQAMTAIVGPNGAGKSTLLKAALGLVPAVQGEVRVFGQPLARALSRIAYVPQRASVDWDFPARAIDVVLMGRYRQTGLFRRIGTAETALARACLARVGMEAFADRQIGALSGGQQQRVFLARALAQGADLYLLDEPFAGVDAATESAIIAVLKSLRDEGRSIIAVHHDLATVPAYFDRVLLLNRRVIAEGPVNLTFRRALVAETYGSALPGAIPA